MSLGMSGGKWHRSKRRRRRRRRRGRRRRRRRHGRLEGRISLCPTFK
jgi:hypothetical protein